MFRNLVKRSKTGQRFPEILQHYEFFKTIPVGMLSKLVFRQKIGRLLHFWS